MIQHRHALRVGVSRGPCGAAREHLKLCLVVFDVVASTALLRDLGDDRYAGVLEGFKDVIHGVMERVDGIEIADTGDGFIHAFESAGHAVAAAEAVFQANRELDADRDRPLRLRCGIHAGELVVSRYGIVGLALYEAVELGNAAGSGELWLSMPVARQAQCGQAKPIVVTLPRSGATSVVVLNEPAAIVAAAL